MKIEIWMDTLQHRAVGEAGAARRRSPDEVRRQALYSRPGWLARELDRRGDETLVADALAAHPELDAALAPRLLDPRRIGIVVDEHLLARLSAALPATSDSAATGLRKGDLP